MCVCLWAGGGEKVYLTTWHSDSRHSGWTVTILPTFVYQKPFKINTLGEQDTTNWLTYVLAVWNKLGSSVANLSIAISAMGPNKTTGLLKPAERKAERLADMSPWLQRPDKRRMYRLHFCKLSKGNGILPPRPGLQFLPEIAAFTTLPTEQSLTEMSLVILLRFTSPPSGQYTNTRVSGLKLFSTFGEFAAIEEPEPPRLLDEYDSLPTPMVWET